MSNAIILNSKNVIGNSNSQFQYNFLNGSFEIKDDSVMSVSQITIPYSWYNITSYLANNTIQYTIPITTGQSTAFTITIPNGFYTISTLNTYIQSVLYSNGHYWISSTTSSNPTIYYPFTFSSNITNYTNQISFQPVPVSSNITAYFGTGYSVGFWSGGTYPTTQGTGTIIIPSGISSFLGFNAGTYQGINTTTPLSVYVSGNSLSVTPPTPPLGSTINGLVVRCSLIENNITIPSDILDSFPINSTFGSNINYMPGFEKWIKIKPGKYSNLVITICDQNNNPINAQDPNVLIVLLIKKNK